MKNNKSKTFKQKLFDDEHGQIEEIFFIYPTTNMFEEEDVFDVDFNDLDQNKDNSIQNLLPLVDKDKDEFADDPL